MLTFALLNLVLASAIVSID